MWIESVRVNYGRLDRTIDLVPGLNVVHGPNEAGKSTLHDALLRTLFGFSSAERRQHRGRAVRDRAQPWGGGPFRATAEVRAVGDRDLRIEWDFAEDTVIVLDGVTGTELLHERPPQRREFTIGPRFFGVQLEEYRQIACLFQGSVGPIEHGSELALQLQRAVASTTPDVGVRAADDRLKDALSEIGVHAGHYGMTPSGALRVATDAATGLRAALEETEAARAELRRLTLELRAARDGLQVEERRLAAIDQTMLRHRSDDRRQRRDQATELQEQIARRPAGPTLVPADIVTAVQAQRVIERQATDRAAELRSDATAAAEAISDLEERCAAFRRERDDLEAYAGVDRSRLGRVRALDAQLSAQEEEPAPPPPPGPDERLERYREERGTLELESDEAPSDRWPVGMLGLAALIAVLAVVVAVVASPIGAIGLALAGVIVWAARPSTRPTPSRLTEALAPYGATDLETLDVQLDAYDRERLVAETRREAWKEAQETREARRAALRAELETTLAGVATPGLPLADQVAAYLRSCDLADQHETHVAALVAAELELAAAREPQRGYDEQLSVADTARGQLAALYARVGIEATDTAAADAAFDALCDRARADAEADAAARRATEALHRLIAGSTVDELAREAEAAAQLLREHIAANGEHHPVPGDLTSLQGLAGTSRATVARLRETVTGLETTISERESNAADPAVLREELAAEDHRIATLTLHRDAIKLAREELETAAEETHRAFAPHLNAALEAALPSITGGRYSRAAVDDDLAVSVVAPETGALVPVDLLSRGTQDQIVMVERLEIARILDPTGGSLSLLLDDPFAHFDPQRLHAGVRLLAEVARTRQVLLFTEDPVVVAAARDEAGEVLELDGPTDLVLAG